MDPRSVSPDEDFFSRVLIPLFIYFFNTGASFPLPSPPLNLRLGASRNAGHRVSKSYEPHRGTK